MTEWEGIGFSPFAEPSELVDQLIAEHPSLGPAAARQGQIFNSCVANA